MRVFASTNVQKESPVSLSSDIFLHGFRAEVFYVFSLAICRGTTVQTLERSAAVHTATYTILMSACRKVTETKIYNLRRIYFWRKVGTWFESSKYLGDLSDPKSLIDG